MAKLIWTPPALRDVERLKALTAHPEAGRPIEDRPPEFREWQIPFGDGGYIVLYRYDGALVAILAVRHGREAGY